MKLSMNENLLPSSHRPEIDFINKLITSKEARSNLLVDILRHIVELGRVDVCLEVFMIALHLTLP